MDISQIFLLIMWLTCVVLFTIIPIYVFVKAFQFERKRKNQDSILDPKFLFNIKIEPMSNNSIQMDATSKEILIRLSGGTKLYGTINNKKLNINVPMHKSWDVYRIDL